MVISTGQGCHHGRVAEVKCAGCQSVSSWHDSTATCWDCSCGNSYVLRRCSACGMVSQVRSQQWNGEPWDCMWCQAPAWFTVRRDPAEATLGDLAADMAQHGRRRRSTAIVDIAAGAADDRDAHLLTATGLSPVR
jgi:hypothetical protein